MSLLVSEGKEAREQREIWSSVVGLLAELHWTLPWLLLQGRKVEGEKALIQSFCIMCLYFCASEQKRFSSSCTRSYTWGTPCQSMWRLQNIYMNSRGVWTNIWRRDPLLGGKGGLLIRQTASSSGNPLSWKCLKAVWMLGRKYFISLPCSCFTLDIHLLPFLEKRFWTLIWPSTVSLTSLGRTFLTAGQASWWILKKIIPS